MSTTITKESAITVLINSVRLAQKNGAYLLRESALLADAIDYFNPDVKEKPTFENNENPEFVAINILLQGVHKGQTHAGEFSYSLEDGRLLWKITDFLVKEMGKGVTQNINVANKEKEKRSVKASALKNFRTSSQDEDREENEDNDDDDKEEEIRPIQVKGKGKEK